MTTLESRFAGRLAALGLRPGRVLVGVSGGSDSLALLLLMRRVGVAAGFEPIAAHVDHGLHPDSAAVARTVAGMADSMGIQRVETRLNLPPGAGESAAREARLAWLETTRKALDARYTFLAHQREDQAETVLMRLLAGSGPAGLAGMREVRGAIVRPLLGFGRGELAAYREAAGWPAWDDPANQDSRHTRSWLRTEVLPILAQRDPAVWDRLARAGAQAADTRDAWDALLETLPGLLPAAERHGVSVAAAPLVGYDSGLLRAVVQAAGRRAGALVGPAAASRVEALLRRGRSGAWVPLGGRWRAELSFDRLRIVTGDHAAEFEATSVGGASVGEVRRGPWLVRWRREAAPADVPRDGWTSWFIPGTWTLRHWRAGDRIKPRRGRGSRLAVRCLQDARVAQDDRRGWPVLVDPAGGPIVWIPGICRAEEAVPPPGSEAMRFDVEPG